ncbi:TPA: glycosyltransferase family 2 protein [Aeromonas hydrophila]|uniref:glycosyltransferase family 2 protein n=1 Tax=Aeromonas hydrophila TaxID=644 RepID=UPI0038D20081
MNNKRNQLVTIVIPCYQQGHLLSRALRSVQSQTYDAIEVIVVDDGSEPAINIEQEEYSFPLALLRQKNQGLSAARNTGLKLAKGNYIKFLDADDELLPECIASQVAMMGSENTISCTGFREINEDTGKETDIIPAFGDALSALLMVNIGPPHIYLFWTSEIRACGGFSQDCRVDGGHEDYDLLLRRVMQGANLITHHSVGVIYYRRDGSMSTVRDRMDKTRAAVWHYNVEQYLIQNEIVSPEKIYVFLASYCNMLKVTPDKYRGDLNELSELLERRLACLKIYFDVKRLNVLLNALSKHQCCQSIVAMLSTDKNMAYLSAQPWPTQAIIDYRLFLQFNDNLFPDDYIVSLLSTVSRYKDDFAIYGAGDMGARISRILKSAGFNPSAHYDRSWQTIPMLNGIDVRNPDELHNNKTKLIIIASFAYRDEIINFVKSKLPQIEVL